MSYAPATVPGAASGLTLRPGDSGVEASWDAPANQGDAQGITRFTVEAIARTGAVAASSTTDGTSAVLTGLTDGSRYTISVAAADAEGTGPSVTASATPALITGSASDITAAQQFLDGRTELQEGRYPSASAATAQSSEASMISTQLAAEQPTDISFSSSLQAAGIQASSGEG